MSGIEILGIAASVISVTDLGGKLSVKLFTFARKIKNADKSISSISRDIAATGAVLHQLGNELKRSDQTRLRSKGLVLTAQTLVNECNNIFAELDEALDDKKKTTPCHSNIRSRRKKARYPFLEPRIELLRTNLERLKSSLIVMLNVLIFAEQLSRWALRPLPFMAPYYALDIKTSKMTLPKGFG